MGYEAAVEAAASFDPTRGVPFAAYAFKRIMGALVRDAPTEVVGSLHVRLRRAFAADPVEVPRDLTMEEALVDSPEAARGRALAWVRRQAAGMLVAALFDASRGATGGEADVVAAEERARAAAGLERALSGLTTDERYFVERHYQDGATFDEISVELGVVTRTVVRLHDHVKTKLAKALRRDGIEREPPIAEEEE